jgi:hypothetical protein
MTREMTTTHEGRFGAGRIDRPAAGQPWRAGTSGLFGSRGPSR